MTKLRTEFKPAVKAVCCMAIVCYSENLTSNYEFNVSMTNLYGKI